MTWGQPHLLWLLAALAALAGLRWWWTRRILAARAAVGAGQPHLTPGVARLRAGLRQALLWGGAALLVVAVAGPRWGAGEARQQATGCDLLVLLDCSRSMLADDLYPSRLEVARRKALDFLRLAPETRTALMPFAGIPSLRCPLTGDHAAIAEMLQDSGPDLFPAAAGFQGTAIGDALAMGLKVLVRQSDRGQAVLILSDGADQDQAAVAEAGRLAKEAGVPVYGLFLGDPERKVELDIDGRREVMDASKRTLDDLAQATGAISVNAQADDRDVRLIHDHLRAHVQQGDWEERRRLVGSERYHWALLPGLALVMAGLLMPLRRRMP